MARRRICARSWIVAEPAQISAELLASPLRESRLRRRPKQPRGPRLTCMAIAATVRKTMKGQLAALEMSLAQRVGSPGAAADAVLRSVVDVQSQFRGAGWRRRGDLPRGIRRRASSRCACVRANQPSGCRHSRFYGEVDRRGHGADRAMDRKLTQPINQTQLEGRES